jgi:hypothetical protein
MNLPLVLAWCRCKGTVVAWCRWKGIVVSGGGSSSRRRRLGRRNSAKDNTTAEIFDGYQHCYCCWSSNSQNCHSFHHRGNGDQHQHHHQNTVISTGEEHILSVLFLFSGVIGWVGLLGWLVGLVRLDWLGWLSWWLKGDNWLGECGLLGDMVTTNNSIGHSGETKAQPIQALDHVVNFFIPIVLSRGVILFGVVVGTIAVFP